MGLNGGAYLKQLTGDATRDSCGAANRRLSWVDGT